MISFTVPGLPIAQPRQRTRVVAKKGKSFAHNYMPAKHPVNAFKAAVQVVARAVFHGPPKHCPFVVRLTFLFPRPKSMIWKTKPMLRSWCRRKPDADNLAKSFCDALNMVLWCDDAQVVCLTVEKGICAGDESPGVFVEIEELQ
jgi:Holliday junction resolvase RusA-like endonuclease